MTINIKNSIQKNIVQLISHNTLQAKHNITVNQVKQTHFSVEGVQSYAPQQLKALKIKEDPFYQNKQGNFIQPKVILLSDQIFQDETQELKNKKQIQDRPKTVPTKNKSQFKSNARNSVSMNNQNTIKLEKQLSKKTQLQRKLDKLRKKYKDHFDGIDLKQKTQKQYVKVINQNDQDQNFNQNQSQVFNEKQSKQSSAMKQQSINSQFSQSQLQIVQESSINKKKNKGNSKKIKKSQKVTNDQTSKVQGFSESNDFQDVQIDWNKKGINFIGQVLQKSTYSERLGTAVHNLFN